MAAELNIAFVTSEVRPFAATGGLGDVASALPKALREQGHQVRLIMPAYAMIADQGHELEEVPGLGQAISVPNLGEIEVKTARLPDSGVQVYFLDAITYDFYRRTQDRATLYGWPDDARRFMLLCRGTLELLNTLGWKPDVIHCNDWQAGLIPAYLDSVYKYDFLNTATLYTTHNILFSGPGGLSTRTLHEASLGLELVPVIHPHEYYGHFNFAKGALSLADVVNTVSPTYAQEILQPESDPLPYPVRIAEGPQVQDHSCRIPNGVGFYNVLRHRQKYRPFLGILNGIDTDYWNPQTDPHLEMRALLSLAKGLSQPIAIEPATLDQLSFGPDLPDDVLCQRKALNKRRLQQICGLKVDEQALLMGRVARIGDQKDYLLMAEGARALQAILEMGCQMVILGRASAQDAAGQWYRAEYERLDKAYPGQLAFVNSRWARWLGKGLPADADFEFEHLLYACSDAFLMPSVYEPCGLSQMVSMRYGSVPIVRRTGGLADTVRDADAPPDARKGGGFVFDEPSPQALIEAVRRAQEVFAQQPARWLALVREGMSRDFSWGPSAREYADAYRLAMEVKRKINHLDG